MAVRGIDVSLYQGNIDFSKVKASGIDTVIIRTSWGANNTDSKAVTNIKNALAAGLRVGVYHFVYALDEAHVKANAERFASIVKPYAKDITMGCWCDWEGDSDSYANKNGISFTKDRRTDMIKLFCEECKRLGLPKVGVYLNPDYLKNKVNDLSMYPLWLACYSSARPTSWPCVMWQYADNGRVDGISGKVDMNEIYDEPTKTTKARPIVIPNMRGEAVAEMQRALIAKGYSCGVTGADGIYGNATKQALGAYQAEHAECGAVDYKCGPKTWASLLKA